MSKEMANGGSTLLVGDILAEFFVKKIEEMEEAKPNDKNLESSEAETNDSSDSENTSEFLEKRRKKSKRKKHKHKKSKNKAKRRHSSRYRHKHKSHKRKHSCDESKEFYGLKRYKSGEFKEDTTVKDESTLPISSSSCSTGTLVITTELKSCDTGNQTTLLVSSNSQQGDNEQQCSDHVGLQTIDTKDKENPKIENLIEADVCKSDDNQHCDAARTGEQVNDNKGVELKNSCSDESCTYNFASSTMDMSEPASASAPSLSDSGSATVASNNTILETVSCSSSKTPLVSNNLTIGSKSRGKIIIKDLSCCQILQKVSKKEKEILDSLEEGEITSEEESDKPREESQSSDTPEEDTPFYNSDTYKEKKSKKKKERHKHKKKKKTSRKSLRRSRSIENERHHHRHDRKYPKTEKPRSSSVDREPYDLRDKIDKARLLKVAQRNVLMMIEQGTLPKGVKIDTLRQEQLLAVKTGGKSVQEFTEFCRALSQKEDVSSSDGSQDKWNEEADTPFIHHPFKLREHHPTIKLNIKNAVQLPIKSPAEKVADAAARLRTQFPVSSGSQHRIKELQWVPVEKDEKQTSKQGVAPVTVISNNVCPAITRFSNVTESKTQVAVPSVDTYNRPYASVPTAYVQPMQQNQNLQNQDYDLSTIVAQRLRAVRRLQENQNDVEALSQLYRVQQKMQEWVQSKQLLGQFTGNTDVHMLSPEELCGPVPVWAKKDQFTRATPVTEGIGMHLLRKMGWNPGEGLGKNKEGVLEPLLPDIKMDKRGLVSDADLSKKVPPQPIRKDLSGKHPVSVLMELCSKRKWGMPIFDLVDENGPDHKKTFLFKVKVNNVEYQPTCSSPNKKHAKAQAATVCLQALGLLPRDLNNPL